VQFHPVDRRLARWLLMTHDRIGANTFCQRRNDGGIALGIPEWGLLWPRWRCNAEALSIMRVSTDPLLDRAALEKSRVQLLCG